MTKKKPTLKEEIQVLRQEIESSANNQELLEEALSVLETQLQDQGWIKLFGGGKELSKSALNTLYDLGRASRHTSLLENRIDSKYQEQLF